jgi:hypothetical protein
MRARAEIHPRHGWISVKQNSPAQGCIHVKGMFALRDPVILSTYSPEGSDPARATFCAPPVKTLFPRSCTFAPEALKISSRAVPSSPSINKDRLDNRAARDEPGRVALFVGMAEAELFLTIVYPSIAVVTVLFMA